MKNDIMKLEDLKIGEKYFINGLSRVARVERVGNANLKQRTPKGEMFVADNAPTVIVRVTIPHKAMEGLVSEKQAIRNTIILNGSISQTVDEDFDDREWEETWAVRRVPRLVANIGQPARLDIMNPVIEVYCVTDTRMNERIRRCSRFEGSKIEGVRIKNPPNLFRDEEIAKVVPPKVVGPVRDHKTDILLLKNESVKEVVHENSPGVLEHMNIQQLRLVAKNRGVDVSDISGSGAVNAMRKRLNGLLV